MICHWVMTSIVLTMEIPQNLTKCQRRLKIKINLAAKLQEVTNISMKIKVRENEQMMLGEYI